MQYFRFLFIFILLTLSCFHSWADVKPFEFSHVINPGYGKIDHMAFLPNGNLFVMHAAREEKRFGPVAIKTVELIEPVSPHNVLWRTDKLWPTDKGFSVSSPVYAIQPSPDGALIAVGTDSAIQIVDSSTGMIKANLEAGKGANSFSFSPDSSLLAFISPPDELVLVLNMKTGELQSKWEAEGIQKVAFSGTDELILIFEGCEIQFRNTEGKVTGAMKPQGELFFEEIPARSADYCAELGIVAWPMLYRTMCLNTATREESVVESLGRPIISPQKTLIFPGSHQQGRSYEAITVRDISTGEELQTIELLAKEMALSVDGKILAIALESGEIQIWEQEA